MAKWEKGVARKRIIFLTCIVVLLGGVTVLYNLFQSPSVGVISNAAPSQEDVKSAEETKLDLEGDTFTLVYPSFYSKTRSGAPENQIVEQYSLSGVDGVRESRRISVTIKKPLAGETVSDDSAYQYRSINPSTYVHSSEAVHGAAVQKFEKSDQSELTYFVPGNGRYAIIAGTSTNNTGGLNKDMKAVVKSFQWKN